VSEYDSMSKDEGTSAEETARRVKRKLAELAVGGKQKVGGLSSYT
jgi:hypothetical protein